MQELKLLNFGFVDITACGFWMHFACWLIVVTSLHLWSGGSQAPVFFVSPLYLSHSTLELNVSQEWKLEEIIRD